jgi:hypothetical protein
MVRGLSFVWPFAINSSSLTKTFRISAFFAGCWPVVVESDDDDDADNEREEFERERYRERRCDGNGLGGGGFCGGGWVARAQFMFLEDTNINKSSEDTNSLQRLGL